MSELPPAFMDYLTARAHQQQRIIVECDGHDFPDRACDHARPAPWCAREMQSAGFKVFRFTGSELYRDAFRCVNEVIVELFATHNRNRE